jgi:hypothetical protein
VAVQALASRLAELLDAAATVLAPLQFVSEPARAATGPCDCTAGCAGRRALLAGRFAAGQHSPTEQAELAGRAERGWRKHGLAITTRYDGGLGHEVVATTADGDVVVFGIGPGGATLSGETGCVAVSGAAAGPEAMPDG